MGSLELEDSCIGSCMSGDVSGTRVYHLPTNSGRTPYFSSFVHSFLQKYFIFLDSKNNKFVLSPNDEISIIDLT